MSDAGWESGDRARLPWRPILAVVAIAAVAGAAWAVRDPDGLAVETGSERPAVERREDVELVVQAPANAGDRWFCAPALPFRAYADRLVYPPQHPAKPDVQERPAACYATLADAQSDGYALAPPPAGAQMVGDLYLVGVDESRVTALCSGATEELGFAVPCPTQLPSPAGAVRCGGTDDSCDFHGAFVLELSDFVVPPAWCDECSTHIAFTAAPLRVRLHSDPHIDGRFVLACGREDILSVDDGFSTESRDLADLPDGFHRCGEGPPWIPGNGGFPHEDHTLYRYRADGVLYGISVEGHGDAQRAVLEAIVDATVLIAGDTP